MSLVRISKNKDTTLRDALIVAEKRGYDKGYAVGESTTAVLSEKTIKDLKNEASSISTMLSHIAAEKIIVERIVEDNAKKYARDLEQLRNNLRSSEEYNIGLRGQLEAANGKLVKCRQKETKVGTATLRTRTRRSRRRFINKEDEDYYSG